MSWLLLTLAIVLEICGTTCMKLSEGFSKLAPSVLIFVFYGHMQLLLWPLRQASDRKLSI
jgi:multidrug transporter EmrE-like cation transporter